jgi:hypothetical protein
VGLDDVRSMGSERTWPSRRWRACQLLTLAALMPNRSPAWGQEAPAMTADTARSLRSTDRGEVIAGSSTQQTHHSTRPLQTDRMTLKRHVQPFNISGRFR